MAVGDGTLVSAREVARWRALIGADSPECKMLHVLNLHQFQGGLPDVQFGCHAIQHRTLLVHPLQAAVDLAGEAEHNMFRLPARRVIETLRDRCIVKAEVAP